MPKRFLSHIWLRIRTAGCIAWKASDFVIESRVMRLADLKFVYIALESHACLFDSHAIEPGSSTLRKCH